MREYLVFTLIHVLFNTCILVSGYPITTDIFFEQCFWNFYSYYSCPTLHSYKFRSVVLESSPFDFTRLVVSKPIAKTV